MKKLMSVVLALVLMLSLVPSAWAASNGVDVEHSGQPLLINGIEFSGLSVYNIGGNNYFKLRDVAMLLNRTGAQFEVGYDGTTNSVTIDVGKSYSPVGGECDYFFNSPWYATAYPSTQKFLVNGDPVSIAAYSINGNNYLKLRDLLSYTSATVDWDAEAKTIIVTVSTQSGVIAGYAEASMRMAYGDEAYAAAAALHDELWSSGLDPDFYFKATTVKLRNGGTEILSPGLPQKLTDSCNQRQIAGVYYYWLTSHVRYDNATGYGQSSTDTPANPRAHTAVGAIVDHHAVCDGFSKAYRLLLTLENIECRVCQDDNHAWNKTVLDGETLYFDVTNMEGCFAESGLMSDTESWHPLDDYEYMDAEIKRCEEWLGWRFAY